MLDLLQCMVGLPPVADRADHVADDVLNLLVQLREVWCLLDGEMQAHSGAGRVPIRVLDFPRLEKFLDGGVAQAHVGEQQPRRPRVVVGEARRAAPSLGRLPEGRGDGRAHAVVRVLQALGVQNRIATAGAADGRQAAEEGSVPRDVDVLRRQATMGEFESLQLEAAPQNVDDDGKTSFQGQGPAAPILAHGPRGVRVHEALERIVAGLHQDKCRAERLSHIEHRLHVAVGLTCQSRNRTGGVQQGAHPHFALRGIEICGACLKHNRRVRRSSEAGVEEQGLPLAAEKPHAAFHKEILPLARNARVDHLAGRRALGLDEEHGSL
mmetsp:Transcript_71603/g.207517  ORF Transcript_71603/g.207517 Transcript_71603/m.207517 type:complete len:324 (+) Transcript_71603:165-1136(+)